MGKLSYEQMRHLAELGDGSGKLTIKNRDGKVLKPAIKKWGGTSTPMLGCMTVHVNGSLHNGVRRSLAESGLRVR